MAAKTVAILHHHLRGGGVTQIIRQQYILLKHAGWRVSVLTGEASADDFPVRATVVPELGYASSEAALKRQDNRMTDCSRTAIQTPVTSTSVQKLYETVVEAAVQTLGSPPSIWHVHNHALGKNPEVTALIALMAKRGEKLLLHIHDFAEDNRPGNYLGLARSQLEVEGVPLREVCYPSGEHVHYAVLNQRDYDYMAAAGFAKKQLHLLANPVDNPAKNNDSGNKSGLSRNKMLPETLFLYPVRAIPRKNIGELVLWAAVCKAQSKDGIEWAVTLPPKNERYLNHYNAWKQFCRKQSLPVVFEAGEHYGLTYAELIEASSCMFTSSMAEGFGMVYLEPWLAGKPLAGRNLTVITRDFSDNGVRFPGLYDTLDIPQRWIDTPGFTNTLHGSIGQLLSDYGMAADEAAQKTTEWVSLIMAGDTIDFGVLDDETQRVVIRHILENPTEANTLSALLPAAGIAAGAIDANREVILRYFSPQAHIQKLEDIYTQLLGAQATDGASISGFSLLQQFLHHSGFSMQRIHN